MQQVYNSLPPDIAAPIRADFNFCTALPPASAVPTLVLVFLHTTRTFNLKNPLYQYNQYRGYQILCNYLSEGKCFDLRSIRHQLLQ